MTENWFANLQERFGFWVFEITRRLPRRTHQFYAWLFGYFWLPCPICRRYFGGHEKGGGSVMIAGVLNRRKMTCPRCPGPHYGVVVGRAGAPISAGTMVTLKDDEFFPLPVSRE